MDIFAKIRIGMSGADQVSNELKKVKRGFEDVRGAAKGRPSDGIRVNPGGSGGNVTVGNNSDDPFSRATGHVPSVRDPNRPGVLPPLEPIHPGEPGSGRERNRRGGVYGQSFVNGAGGAAGAAGTLEHGNVLGAGGSALGSVAGFMGRFAAPALIASIALKYASNIGAEGINEGEALVKSGANTRLGLGSDPEATNKSLIDMKWDKERILTFKEARAASGAQGESAGGYGLSQAYGTDPASLGRLAGTGFQTGINVPSRLPAKYRVNAGLYGKVANDISTSLEEAMVQGMKVKGDVFKGILESNIAETNKLMVFGGVTYAGASNIQSKIRNTGYGAEKLSRPEDVMMFMSQYDPNLSYQENLRNVSSPNSTKKYMNNLLKWSGGNGDKVEQELMTSYGMTANEAHAKYLALTGKFPEGSDPDTGIIPSKNGSGGNGNGGDGTPTWKDRENESYRFDLNVTQKAVKFGNELSYGAKKGVNDYIESFDPKSAVAIKNRLKMQADYDIDAARAARNRAKVGNKLYMTSDEDLAAAEKRYAEALYRGSKEGIEAAFKAYVRAQQHGKDGQRPKKKKTK